MLRVRDPAAPIRSDLETLLFRALRRARLRLPKAQHPVRTRNGVRYIDFAYPKQRLAIEIDGWKRTAHAAFESDRARQNELEELDWHFRRFPWKRVTPESAEVAVTIGPGLGLMPVRWRD